jgi:hypothetical protein
VSKGSRINGNLASFERAMGIELIPGRQRAVHFIFLSSRVEAVFAAHDTKESVRVCASPSHMRHNEPVATYRPSIRVLVMSLHAPNRVPRPNCYVQLGRRREWNGSQRFGPIWFLLMVLLAAPMQAGCAGSSGIDVQPPQQPISYLVKLDWIASTSPVIGYNVYRGTESGGPSMLLNSSLVTTTQYEDSSIQSGRLTTML